MIPCALRQPSCREVAILLLYSRSLQTQANERPQPTWRVHPDRHAVEGALSAPRRRGRRKSTERLDRGWRPRKHESPKRREARRTQDGPFPMERSKLISRAERSCLRSMGFNCSRRKQNCEIEVLDKPVERLDTITSKKGHRGIDCLHSRHCVN